MSSASRAPTATPLPMVTTGGRVPILSWATPLEGSALEQARNLANLPFAIDHVALMPDAHTGYGMPIGGVLFADRAVVPYAIGVVKLDEGVQLAVRLAPDSPGDWSSYQCDDRVEFVASSSAQIDKRPCATFKRAAG